MSLPLRCLTFGYLILVTAFPLVAVPAQLAEKPATQGILSMSGKPYQLAHAVAYETQASGKSRIVVIASDRSINPDPIKKILRENNGSDSEVSLRQPHVKLTFEPSGKIVSCYAYAAGFTTNTSGDALQGAMRLDGGRVTGQAKLAVQGEGQLQRSFEFQFAAGLLGSTAEQAPSAVPLAKLGVSGVFKGNGKDAKLAFVSARPGEPFAGKPGMVLVFTERDHARAPRPDFRAAFGDFGSALIISCHADGSIFGCEVAHAAHSKKPFSSSGNIETIEFQMAGGQVQGQLTTNGEAKAFDESWEVNLKFAAPFAGFPKAPDSNATAGKATKPKTARSEPAEPSPANTKPVEKSVAAKLNVKDLSILQGVEEVEFKSVVEHIAFASSTNYKTLAGELAKKLDTQGWTKDGSDLIGVSAILKRKRGAAKLTIFVKPAANGSQVTIMTEGLAWD